MFPSKEEALQKARTQILGDSVVVGITDDETEFKNVYMIPPVAGTLFIHLNIRFREFLAVLLTLLSVKLIVV